MTPELVIAIGIGLSIGVPLVWLSANKFRVGAAIFFMALYLKAFLDPEFSLQIGIAIYPLDLAFLVLMVAAALRALGGRILAVPLIPFCLLLGLFGFSFLQGLAQHGTAAGVVFRKFFYFLTALAYFSTYRYTADRVRETVRAWLVFSGFLLASVLVRWTVDLGSIGLPFLRPNSEESLRVVPSDMALILAQSALLLLTMVASGSKNAPRAFAFSGALLLAVVALQHRSVWIAACLGLLFAQLMSANSRMAGRLVRGSTLAVLCCVLAAGTVGALGYYDVEALVHSLQYSLDTAVTLDTTAGERLNSWRVLLEMWADGGYRAWVAGFPFGTSPTREVMTTTGEFRTIEYGAHNAFVEILFYGGGLALAGFLTLYAKLFLGLFARKAELVAPTLYKGQVAMLLVMQLCYYVPYGIEFAQAIWIAVAAGSLRGVRSNLSPRPYGTI